MPMRDQHPTQLGGGVRLQESRRNREKNIHIKAACLFQPQLGFIGWLFECAYLQLHLNQRSVRNVKICSAGSQDFIIIGLPHMVGVLSFDQLLLIQTFEEIFKEVSKKTGLIQTQGKADQSAQLLRTKIIAFILYAQNTVAKREKSCCCKKREVLHYLVGLIFSV